MENINFCRTLFEETRFMNLLIKSTLSSIVAKHGLNPYQAHLLGEIASQDGQTIKELAYHLCVKPSNFKPIAQPMAERGLIERRTKTTSAASASTSRKGAAPNRPPSMQSFLPSSRKTPMRQSCSSRSSKGLRPSANSQASTASSKPPLPIPTQERKTRWVSPAIK